MFDLFLKLLGVENAEDAHIVERRIAFANLKTPFQILLFLMASAGAAYVVWWFYKREPDYCPIKKRRIMAALRFCGISILLFILSGPVLKLTLQNNVKGKVVILVDNSKSMSRVDKYTRAEDKLVVAHALGKIPLKEADSKKNEMAAEQAIAGVTRMDIVRGILKNPEFNFLETLQRKYDVEMHTYSRASDMKAVLSDG